MIQLEQFKKWGATFLTIMIILLIIYIILVAYNNNVSPILSFLESTPTEKAPLEPAGVNSQSLYIAKPAPSDTALVFDKVSLKPQKFTISFDCFLNGTYLSTDIPRVLMYFGNSAATGITNTNFKDFKLDTLTTGPIPVSQSDLANFFPNTNFIVYADPVKNDLKVAFLTINDASGRVITNVEFAPTINNIDINTPFKITIVVNAPNPKGQFVEIYKNTKLLSTYKIQNRLFIPSVLKGTQGPNPLIPPTEYPIYLYSPIKFIGDTIQIGNIQYFDNAITSSQVRTLTNTLVLPSFFQKIATPT